jgi:hypothetical protein
VTAPRVNDRRIDPQTGERARFSSAILPPWCRKTPKITGVLPLLYLHGLSSGDFVPALGQFLGSSAGLSAPVITKLTETWKAEQRTFSARDLSAVDYVYLWADGIHVNIRLEEHKLCLLVLIGVRADGRKLGARPGAREHPTAGVRPADLLGEGGVVGQERAPAHHACQALGLHRVEVVEHALARTAHAGPAGSDSPRRTSARIRCRPSASSARPSRRWSMIDQSTPTPTGSARNRPNP